MIHFVLTLRLTYWRTIQTWHGFAAGWPALTKAGRARRRRHRTEHRTIRVYTRYLAADRAQIFENVASRAVSGGNNPHRTEYPTDRDNARDARDIAENIGRSNANAEQTRDTSCMSVICPEAITPTL